MLKQVIFIGYGRNYMRIQANLIRGNLVAETIFGNRSEHLAEMRALLSENREPNCSGSKISFK